MENIKLSKIIKLLFSTAIGGVLLVVFLVPFLLSLTIKYVPYGFQPPLYLPEKISSEKEFRQEVTAMMDGLTGIGLSIKNPNLRNKDDLTLSVFEKDILLRQVAVSGWIIPDGDLIK